LVFDRSVKVVFGEVMVFLSWLFCWLSREDSESVAGLDS